MKDYKIRNIFYKKLIKSYKYIPYTRLKNNKKWLDINNKILRKIYSNIQVKYDFDFNLDEFVPINKLELLYKNDDCI